MEYTKSSLSNCINSLSSSVALLNDSLKILDEATKDLPRVRHVLETEKVFTLVPESDLIGAKNDLQDKIEPQIMGILERIETDLSKLERRKISLVSKVDLQQIRLETASKHAKRYSQGIEKVGSDGQSKRKIIGNEQQFSRLKFLNNKQDRLKYSLSRLNLQDRKARMSMATK